MLEVIFSGLITTIVSISLVIAVKNSGCIGEFKSAIVKMNGLEERLNSMEGRLKTLESGMTLLLNSRHPTEKEE